MFTLWFLFFTIFTTLNIVGAINAKTGVSCILRSSAAVAMLACLIDLMIKSGGF